MKRFTRFGIFTFDIGKAFMISFGIFWDGKFTVILGVGPFLMTYELEKSL